MAQVTRRSLIGGAAALIAAPSPLHAKAPLVGKPGPAFYRFRLGSYEITALYDGIWEKPHDPAFIANASVDDVKGAMMDALTQTSGKDFDDTYIAQQRRIQQEQLALHQRYAADGDNDILRDYAVDTAARAADQLDEVNNLPRR